jgi:peptidoglycan/LPS O-acetylase OafA/YrhL
MSSKPLPFRKDINGLRALAVLAVVFYHFGVPGFGGGYVGVDVFYVISGFLMTQIICTKLESDSFRLAGFYMARARRIVPALAGLVGILVLLGMFFLPPDDYKTFGWHALSSLTFVSNIVFSHGGGYFDTAAWEKWLLHTWSLSVEWQFYLLLPLCLLGLERWGGKKYIVRGAIVGFGLSLLLSALLTPVEPTEAFFVLPTRAWEMMAGALVFLYGAQLRKNPLLFFSGLGCILAAMFFFTGDLEVPGLWVLLPVAGTAAMIAARRENALLDSRTAQFLGTISYSLYLWHWPVMVGAKYLNAVFTPLHVALMLALTLGLATLSYFMVEAPFRRAGRAGARGLGAYAALALLSYIIYAQGGLPGRVSADVLAATQAAKPLKAQKRGDCATDYKNNSVPPRCLFGAEAAPTAALWGDSHAPTIAWPLQQELVKAKRAALLYAYAGCPPILDAVMANKSKKHQCRLINRATLDTLIADTQISDVFLTSRWSLYLMGYNEKSGNSSLIAFDEETRTTPETLDRRARQYGGKMRETFCALTGAGKRVHVLLPVPELGREVSAALARSRMIFGEDAAVDISLAEYRERNALVLAALKDAARACRVHLLDPAPLLCDGALCRGVRGGVPLYADDNHLNGFGGNLLQPLLGKALKN